MADTPLRPPKHETVFARRALLGMVIVAALVGLLLRLRLLTGQTLVDDEWHTLSFVIGRPLSWVLTHFSVPSGFTSIPLNLYAWALLQTVGWSELLLRLPSLLLGLGLIVAGPRLARPIISSRAAGVFGLLLAISPLLVFYTRLARPYSAVACLGFLSIMAAARWLQSGRLRDGIAYAVCGLLTVYCHPFAAISIGCMGASVLLASLLQARRASNGTPAVLRWGQVLAVLGAAAAAGAALMLPALLDSFQSSMGEVARQGSIHAASWWRLMTLFGGTAHAGLAAGMLGLSLWGLIHLVKTQRWLGVTLGMLFPLQMLAMLAVGPHSSHVGIVLARYSLILLPVYLMLAAIGLISLFDRVAAHTRLQPRIQLISAVLLVLTLLLAGPLPRCWRAPNNFTNHGVFQHDYRPLDWSHSFDSEFAPEDYPVETRIRTEELTPFYGFLRQQPGARPIVEYPMMIGDHFNPHYFAQWYHQRPVLLGYAVGLVPPAPLQGGGVYGNSYADDLLNLVPAAARLHFRNHIAMRDLALMRERDVEYVVIHKRFEAEFDRIARPPPSLPAILAHYRAQGHLIFEDNSVAVFNVDKEAP